MISDKHVIDDGLPVSDDFRSSSGSA